MKTNFAIIAFCLAAACFVTFVICESRVGNMTPSLIAQGFDQMNIPAELQNDRLQLKNDQMGLELAKRSDRAAIRARIAVDETAIAKAEIAVDQVEANRPIYELQSARAKMLKSQAAIAGWAGIVLAALGVLLLRRKRASGSALVAATSMLFIVCSFSPAWCANAGPTLFIDAQSDFASALTAAMIKKKVPATVVEDKTAAEYYLVSAAVDSKDETGAGKIARCLFLDCIGMNGFSEVSVKLVRSKDSAVVWAYQVRKSVSGPVGIQSLSEAIAKHLKSDYLVKAER
jgi:hypothetical protein